MSNLVTDLTLPLLLVTSAGLALPAPSFAASVRVEATAGRGADDLSPVAAEIDSDGKRLIVVLETNFDVADFLSHNMATEVAEILVDTDLDATTGGHSFRSEGFGALGGYEYVATVNACKEFEGGEVCAGDVGPDEKITGFHSSYEPTLWDGAKESLEPIHGFFWSGGNRPVDGSSIRVEIPYDDLGVKAGAKIRLSILPSRYGAGRFQDVEIPLR